MIHNLGESVIVALTRAAPSSPASTSAIVATVAVVVGAAIIALATGVYRSFKESLAVVKEVVGNVQALMELWVGRVATPLEPSPPPGMAAQFSDLQRDVRTLMGAQSAAMKDNLSIRGSASREAVHQIDKVLRESREDDTA